MSTETTQIATPEFRVHARAPAFFRAAVVAALCAALTAGFLAQVWRGAPQTTPAAANDSQMATCTDAATGDPC